MGIVETINQISYEEGIERGIEQGIEQGIEKNRFEVIKNLILSTDFDDHKIALIVNVEITIVRKVRAEIAKT